MRSFQDQPVQERITYKLKILHENTIIKNKQSLWHINAKKHQRKSHWKNHLHYNYNYIKTKQKLPYTSPNACWKRNVLSLVLNRLRVFAFLMSAGKLFHSVGAAEEKARVPNVANILPLGIFNKTPPVEEWPLSEF